MRKIINCNVHDHFEIACMRQSVIQLTLHDGREIIGRAKDLVTKNKSEFIFLEIDNQDDNERINLTDIHTLTIEGNNNPMIISQQ